MELRFAQRFDKTLEFKTRQKRYSLLHSFVRLKTFRILRTTSPMSNSMAEAHSIPRIPFTQSRLRAWETSNCFGILYQGLKVHQHLWSAFGLVRRQGPSDFCTSSLQSPNLFYVSLGPALPFLAPFSVILSKLRQQSARL